MRPLRLYTISDGDIDLRRLMGVPSVAEARAQCGQGLAEHSVLPAKVGELLASLAQILELHMKALDLTDENSKREHDAYLLLAREYRKIAAQ